MHAIATLPDGSVVFPAVSHRIGLSVSVVIDTTGELLTEETLHRCPCCRMARPWREYQGIGVQDLSGYGMASLELANCPACGSTTSREVAP